MCFPIRSGPVHGKQIYHGYSCDAQDRGSEAMTRRPFATFFAVLGVTVISACAQGDARFGVCRQQITDYVELRLGLTLTRIEVQSYAERMPPRTILDVGSALVYVEECTGFHGFEIRATEDLCEYIPHYGSSSGPYIRYEGGFEGCKAG
jgi:hypothetical protein